MTPRWKGSYWLKRTAISSPALALLLSELPAVKQRAD